ncbi:MAG: sugar nucleotide-binding protein, partial [Pseudomonadales bacterium]|nr:sugar nucleotide-binding protein [Pseudomonadales bacterium]
GPLFCTEGDNLLTRLLAELRTENPEPFCIDEYLAPTSSAAIARVLVAILKQLSCDIEPWGVYHYCAADITNRYDFAEVVLAIVNQYDKRYTDISLQSAERRRERTYRVFNCEKIRNTFGIKQMPWKTELVSTLRQLYQIEKNASGE